MPRIPFIAPQRRAIAKGDHYPQIVAAIRPGTVRPVCTRNTPGIIRNECAARLSCARSAERSGCFSHIKTTWVTVDETGGAVWHAPSKREEQIASLANPPSLIGLISLNRLMAFSCRSFEQIPVLANLFA
jgi:hypothetical protein